MIQPSLFDQAEITSGVIDKSEAPHGFVPVLKSDATTPNVCNSCDARGLCVENKDNWCSQNPCMSYRRQDGAAVIFKRA